MGLERRSRVVMFALALAVVGTFVGPRATVARGAQTFKLAPAVRVYAMTAGPEGKMWFAGYRGVAQPPAPPAGGVLGSVSPRGKVSESSSGGGALSGIAVGADGELWSTEPAGRRIVRMSTSGSFSYFVVPGQGAELSSIAAGPDGALWFTEGKRDEIGRIMSDGQISEFPLPAGSDARAIVAGSDGGLWLAARGKDSIDRVGTDGAVASFPIGGGPTNEPRSLALGPDGNVFFTQKAASIGRISPDGAIVEFGRPRPAALIASGPDEDLWFSTRTRPYKDSSGPGDGIASITTSGQTTAAVCAHVNPDECSAAPSALASGPEGALWFAEGSRTVEGGGASAQLAQEEAVAVGRFTPPRPGVSVLGPILLRGARATLDLFCGGGTAGDRCQGRLDLKTKGDRGLPVGSVRFDLHSGQSRFVRISLDPKARKLVGDGSVSRISVTSSFPVVGPHALRIRRVR